MPMTTRSARSESRGQTGACQPSGAGEQQDTDRLAEQQSSQHEVRARSDLRERDAGVRQTKEEQHELHRRRPPVFELVERVGLEMIFSGIEQPKITRTVRHEGHDGDERQGRMEATEVERGP